MDTNNRETNYTVSLVNGTLTVTNAGLYPTPYTFVTLAGMPTNSGTNDGTGNGARFYGPFGVAMDSGGNIYVTDELNYTVRKVTSTGTVTTLAGGSTEPHGIAVDAATNLYVTTNDVVERLTLSGSNWVVTILATNLFAPLGLAVDSATNIYVADSGNDAVERITQSGTNWVVTTLAGGTMGTNEAGPTAQPSFILHQA